MKKLSSTPEQCRDAEIYIKAAALVERENQYSCSIIKHLGGKSGDYADLFKQDGGHCQFLCLLCSELQDDETQAWRVLALCFMAAMVEAGDA